MREVRLVPRGTVYAYLDHNYLAINERLTDHLSHAMPETPRERIWRVRAAQVVLATGAHERPLVFRNNDRPGVIMASAILPYINRHAVKPGERALVFTNNDSATETALDLLRVGVEVAAVVDARHKPAGGLAGQIEALGVKVKRGFAVTDVAGGHRVRGATIHCRRAA